MVAAALGQGIGVSVIILVDQLVVLAAIVDPEAHGFQSAPDAGIEGACAAQQVLQGVAMGVGRAVGQRVGAHDGLENVVATAVRGDVLPGVSQGIQYDAQDLLVVEVALRAWRQQDVVIAGTDFALAQSLDLFLGFLQELLLGGDFLTKTADAVVNGERPGRFQGGNGVLRDLLSQVGPGAAWQWPTLPQCAVEVFLDGVTKLGSCLIEGSQVEAAWLAALGPVDADRATVDVGGFGQRLELAREAVAGFDHHVGPSGQPGCQAPGIDGVAGLETGADVDDGQAMVAVAQDEVGGQGEFVAGQQSGLIRDAQGAVQTAAQGIQQGGDDGGIPVDGQVGLGQAGGAFDADAKPGIACGCGVRFREDHVREVGISCTIFPGLEPPGEDDGGDPGQVLFLAAVADAGHCGVGLPSDQGLQQFTAGIDAG